MVEFIDGPELASRADSTGVRAEEVPNTDHTSYDDESIGYALQEYPLQQGLVGWWPLAWDGAYDLSGNDNHGTVNGPTTGVVGRGGLSAMSFDGVDDTINIPTMNVNSSSNGLSFGGWVNPRFDTSSNTNEYPIWRAWNDSNNNTGVSWGYVSGADGSVTVEWSDDRFNYSYPNNDRNDWIHIFVASTGKSSETLRLYINGQEVMSYSPSGNQTVEGNIDSALGSNQLSGDPDSGQGDHFWNGSIFDFRVYDRGLSASEIQLLYELGSADVARDPTDGVARYALDGDATDSFGSNDGTNNGVTFVDNAIRGQAAEFVLSEGDSIDAGFHFSPTELSASFWVKPDSSISGNLAIPVIMGAASSPVGGWGVWIDGRSEGKTVRGTVSDGTGSGFDEVNFPISNLPFGEWAHIVYKYVEGSTHSLYLNGSKMVEAGTSQSIADNTRNVTLGSESGGGYYYGGLIDDVRIYDRALSPQEVFQLYLWGTRGIDMTQHTVMV